MAPLLIDAEELIIALEYHGHEAQFFLDLQTGEVIFVHEDSSGDDPELEKLMKADPTRFRAVEPVRSSVGWGMMSGFIEQLPDGEASRKLSYALEGKQAFRRFKDTLGYYPQIREQWFAFHTKAMVELAREWLDDEEIEATLKLRGGVEA